MTFEELSPVGSDVHAVRTSAIYNLDEIGWKEWQRPSTWPVGEVVYTLADDDGVFYVGVSADVGSRMSAHRSQRGFGRRARYMRALTVTCRDDAKWLERHMIFLFDPSENTQHRRSAV